MTPLIYPIGSIYVNFARLVDAQVYPATDEGPAQVTLYLGVTEGSITFVPRASNPLATREADEQLGMRGDVEDPSEAAERIIEENTVIALYPREIFLAGPDAEIAIRILTDLKVDPPTAPEPDPGPRYRPDPPTLKLPDVANRPDDGP